MSVSRLGTPALRRERAAAPPGSLRRALLAGLVALVAGLAIELQGLAQRPARPAADPRYAEIVQNVPSGATVGYLSDLRLDTQRGMARYLRAQLALAPRVLREDAQAELVLADFLVRGELGRALADGAWEPVVVTRHGTALLRRR